MTCWSQPSPTSTSSPCSWTGRAVWRSCASPGHLPSSRRCHARAVSGPGTAGGVPDPAADAADGRRLLAGRHWRRSRRGQAARSSRGSPQRPAGCLDQSAGGVRSRTKGLTMRTATARITVTAGDTFTVLPTGERHASALAQPLRQRCFDALVPGAWLVDRGTDLDREKALPPQGALVDCRKRGGGEDCLELGHGRALPTGSVQQEGVAGNREGPDRSALWDANQTDAPARRRRQARHHPPRPPHRTSPRPRIGQRAAGMLFLGAGGRHRGTSRTRPATPIHEPPCVATGPGCLDRHPDVHSRPPSSPAPFSDRVLSLDRPRALPPAGLRVAGDPVRGPA